MLLEGSLNDALHAAGIPEARLQGDPLTRSTEGSFGARSWKVQVNLRFLQRTLQRLDVERLIGVLFHEATHAEQFYQMARVLAAEGKSAGEISKALSLDPHIADAAKRDPM